MNEIIKRNNVKVSGFGAAPMVFAHGFIGDQNQWRHVAPSFYATNKVVLFDYVGSGKSDVAAYDAARYSSLAGYAKDLIEVCEATEVRDVVFVGHSVSSMIGLLAAIEKPDLFSKLVFVAPSPCYINDKDYNGGFDRREIDLMMTELDVNPTSWARETLPIVVNNPDQPNVAEELHQAMLSAEHRILKQFAITTFFSDHRRDLLRLDRPCLILQASQDVMAPLQVGDYLHAHLEKSKLRVLHAKGHFPHLTAPREVVAAIKEFLEK